MSRVRLTIDRLSVDGPLGALPSEAVVGDLERALSERLAGLAPLPGASIGFGRASAALPPGEASVPGVADAVAGVLRDL